MTPLQRIHRLASEALANPPAAKMADTGVLVEICDVCERASREQPSEPPRRLVELLDEADKWVKDSGHWVKSDPYRGASHLILELATALRHFEATLLDTLVKHFSIEVRCTHATGVGTLEYKPGTDECICSCGTWPAPKMSTIGEAIRTWGAHVVDALRAESAAARVPVQTQEEAK